MKWNDLGLAKKMAVGFGAVLLVLAGAAMLSLSSIGELVGRGRSVAQINAIGLELIQREVDHLDWVRKLEHHLFVAEGGGLEVQLDPTRCGLGAWYYGEGRREAEAQLGSLKMGLAALEGPHRRLHEGARTIGSLTAQGKREQARAFFEQDTLPTLENIRKLIRQSVEQTKQGIQATGREMEAEAVTVRNTLIEFSLALGLLVLGVVFLLSRSVTVPIQQVVEVAKRVARGELDMQIQLRGADEAGQLLLAMQQMVLKLRTTFAEVRGTARALSGAAAQVAATSQSLAQGTSEQAASVEETTSVLEQMSASITQNSNHSRESERMAISGAKKADACGKAVAQTVQAMGAITEKMGIVEELAYRTNLLSLNAAVEAARAGALGRGFAVVASEVRKLAERSQGASKEIRSVADQGMKVADRSGELLRELVPAIESTANLVQEVSTASKEQASGVSQMNRTVLGMGEVTQRNASASEELASTAEELSSQAETLQALLDSFKLGEEHSGSGRPAALPHRARPPARVAA